ncbi:MAG: hypothetical protein NT007_08585 [Candidatus Kapabacteria bacterium]|nr:hypothetical protein [Candidatus Kapabacteria bacterium]
MYEVVFNSILTENGTIYCPNEYSFKDAEYKVIVHLPDQLDEFINVEASAIIDNSIDFLYRDEVQYYLGLD